MLDTWRVQKSYWGNNSSNVQRVSHGSVTLTRVLVATQILHSFSNILSRSSHRSDDVLEASLYALQSEFVCRNLPVPLAASIPLAEDEELLSSSLRLLVLQPLVLPSEPRFPFPRPLPARSFGGAGRVSVRSTVADMAPQSITQPHSSHSSRTCFGVQEVAPLDGTMRGGRLLWFLA